ncbi:MAG: hypothetical protein WBP08_02410, partial [Saprospiraceae bacterium]
SYGDLHLRKRMDRPENQPGQCTDSGEADNIKTKTLRVTSPTVIQLLFITWIRCARPYRSHGGHCCTVLK